MSRGNNVVSMSDINVVKMNSSTLLQSWYDPKQQCLLQKRGQPITSQSLFQDCSGKNTSVSTPYGFFHLPSLVSGRTPNHFCCVEDGLELIDRGFDEVVEGYEDASQKPILKLLSFLSKSNRSLAILGDSMSVQLYWALLEEIARERVDGELIRDILPYDLIAWDNFNETVISTEERWKQLKAGAAKWIPSPTVGPNSVYFYNLRYYSSLFTNAVAVEKLIPYLSQVVHPGGLLVLTNLGLHLTASKPRQDVERSKNTELIVGTMTSALGSVVVWLNQLSDISINPKNIAVFYETTPTHFASPDGDGDYRKWSFSDNSSNDTNKGPRDEYGKKWGFSTTSYRCHPNANIHRNTSDFDYWSVEGINFAVRSTIDSWNTWHPSSPCRVSVLRVTDYLRPFWKMKYGYCGRDGSRTEKLDCAHYCFNAPQIWMPIWHNLVDIVYDRSNSSTYDLESKNETLLFNDPSKCQLIREPNSGSMYCVEFGLRRSISDNHLLSETPAGAVKNVTREEFAKIPIGMPLHTTSFPNGSLVRPIVGTAIFLIKTRYRHLIPDFDTLQCLQRLGYAKGSIQVIWEIDLLKFQYGVPLAPMECV